jgi:uncharacterized protein YwgA
MSGNNVTNRMGDVFFALGEAATADIQPAKIQLQKFIYLTDVVGQLLGVLRLRDGYKTYRNGPYDVAIQNAVDSLAFRGFVNVAGTWKTPSGHLAVRYTLARQGQEMLQTIRASNTFARKTRIAAIVGAEVRNLGWHRIVSLVYAEPTFVATRSLGWGAPLLAENGLDVSAAFILAIMRRFAEGLRKEAATPVWLADRFFAYLGDYAEKHTAAA